MTAGTSALVLLYHSVSDDPLPGLARWTIAPAVLEAHARLIAASGRPVLVFSDLMSARRSGTAPPDAVVMTFDDGYRDNLLAAEILAASGLRATIYVTVGALGRERMLPPAGVRDLASAGWEIGSHGMTHRRLDELPIGVAREELQASGEALASLAHSPIVSYAYPHGSFTSALAREAAQAGYTSATAVRDCLSPADDDPFSVARMTVMAGLGEEGLEDWLVGTGLPTSTPTRPALTSAYRALRRARTRIRGRAVDELDDRLASLQGS